MARPQTDIDAGRAMLLVTVEDMIRERGAVDISMTELATVSGMSPSNIYRFFENKEALFEAIAEQWFAEKAAIMEEVVASDLLARDKMYEFFQRRFAVMVTRFTEEPDLFRSYCELGHQHFEVVRGYVDLGDHFLAMIVAEAMEQGHFLGVTIDRAVSLINLMVQPFCNPDFIAQLAVMPTEEKLGQVIDTIFAGLGQKEEQAESEVPAQMRLVS
jgi:TetR/AcrR family transcriptional regulator, repressor of the ameABC operon